MEEQRVDKMAYIDRIFVVMAALALIVYLIAQGSRASAQPDIPTSRVNQSVPKYGNPVGNAYQVSNLPLYRDSDDTLRRASIGRNSAISAGAIAV